MWGIYTHLFSGIISSQGYVCRDVAAYYFDWSKFFKQFSQAALTYIWCILIRSLIRLNYIIHICSWRNACWAFVLVTKFVQLSALLFTILCRCVIIFTFSMALLFSLNSVSEIIVIVLCLDFHLKSTHSLGFYSRL